MQGLKRPSTFAALAVTWALALFHAPEPAAAEPRFVKGPYLMDVRPDSVAVLFELDSPAPAVVVAQDASGAAKRFEAGATTWHEVVLRGLEPGTRHRYEVLLGGDGSGRARGSFTTAPAPGSTRTTRFLVYGDARTDAAAHQRIVRRMRDEEADFVLHTGDMLADGSEPSDWQEYFDVSGPLYAELPVFPTLGNHEAAGGDGMAPYRRFVRTRESPGDEAFYAFDHGPVRVLVLDSNQPFGEGSPQLIWLEGEVARARAPGAPLHLFAAIHHGPYSSGAHGSNREIQGTRAEELLRTAGVALVFEGHDHAFERGDARGLKYLLSGGAGAPLYVTNRRLPSQLAFEPAHHYVRVEIDGPDVRITAIRKDGSVLDACGFTKGGPWRCGGGRDDGRGRVVEMPVGTVEALVRFWPQLAALVAVVLVVTVGIRRARAARKNGGRKGP
jgi:hypothetical protein